MADKPASFRCKIEDWHEIHSGFTLTLRPGYTALVGPNGAGKTTLLRQLEEKAKSRGFLTFRYSNLESGAKESRQGWLMSGQVSLVATSALSSEGENITIAFQPAVKQIGAMVAKAKEEDKPLMILLDALDSGSSIDRLRDIRRLFDMILKDLGVLDKSRPDREAYIVAAVNSYELASGAACVDPRTGKTMTFGDYAAYADYICSYDLTPKKGKKKNAEPETVPPDAGLRRKRP